MTQDRRSISTQPPVGPPPPFDTELAAFLPAVQQIIPADGMRAGTIAQLRVTFAQSPGLTNDQLARDGRFEVWETAAPGEGDNPAVPLLVCTPRDRIEPVPALYFIHGGGMVLGDFRCGIDEKIEWADELGTALVSVDYRLAPENRHPAPIDDCYAGLSWLAASAQAIGVDPNRIVIVGESAGGGLAAALALLARDRGGPALFGQILICPMLDDRNDSLSSLQMAGLGIWDRISNETGWAALLGDAHGGPVVSPYASPARAADLSKLPPTFIDVGSAETFRDEDVEYASRIWASGGIAELHVWGGGWHGFDADAPAANLSQSARAARIEWLRRLMGPGCSAGA